MLPVAFLGQNDSEESVREQWEHVWTEGAGSAGVGVRLYMGELAQYIPTRLANTSWEARRAAAVACKVMADELGSSIHPHLDALMGAVESCVAGRIWDGKDQVRCLLVHCGVCTLLHIHMLLFMSASWNVSSSW